MENLQANTEFILTKLDSVFQKALPHLQNGAEEVVTYQVIKFQANYVLWSAFWLIFLIASSISIMKGLKAGKKAHWIDGPYWAAVIAGGFGVVISVIGIGNTIISDGTKFALSIATPEMFTIMEMLGKN